MTKARSTQEKFPTFLDDQRHFFDEIITQEWDTYENPDWDRRRRFELECLFSLVHPRLVLDVGCGCGFHDVVMADMPGVEHVVGIDYSPKSVETANKVYAHPHVERRAADITDMSGADKFDLVVSFQVIEHLSDPVAFLRRCRAQTATDGTVAVVTPNRLRLSNRLRILAGGQPRLGDPQHFKEYVNADLVALGAEAGLACIGSFAYGLTLTIPRLGRSLLPTGASLSLGRLFAPAADCIGVVYRRSR